MEFTGVLHRGQRLLALPVSGAPRHEATSAGPSGCSNRSRQDRGSRLGRWLWRRLYSSDPQTRLGTPRRLVYCLPMRTLVEQTRDRARWWLGNLGLSERIPVSLLMGGEEPDDWYLYPEQERIIIGTQHILLSRALNRGYAASPFRWPCEFGLLNNDCLWVLDEVQLMANGLPTSAQLQAFRRAMGTYGACETLWMSATLQPDWLHTVDSPAPSQGEVFVLSQEDATSPDLARRLGAARTLRLCTRGRRDYSWWNKAAPRECPDDRS